jgi:hypothetical protein
MLSIAILNGEPILKSIRSGDSRQCCGQIEEISGFNQLSELSRLSGRQIFTVQIQADWSANHTTAAFK